MADAIGYQPATRTAQNVISHVQRIFGDQDGVQIQSTDIITWINDAQEQIVNKTRPLKTRSTSVSVANQAEYKLPGNAIIEVESLLYDGAYLHNTPYARAERDYFTNSLTPVPTGVPTTWWEWNGSFTLYPTPTTPATITLLYSMLATPVGNPSDILGVPDKYYQTLLTYVMQQAYELDENMSASEMKANQFNQNLDTFNEEERVAQHMYYEKMTYVEQWY